MLGKSIVSKWCATLDDIFGIVTCVSVHDYDMYSLCLYNRTEKFCREWRLAHYFVVAFEFMFGFNVCFLSLIRPTGRGGRRQRRCKYIYQKNYDNKNNFVKIRG